MPYNFAINKTGAVPRLGVSFMIDGYYLRLEPWPVASTQLRQRKRSTDTPLDSLLVLRDVVGRQAVLRDTRLLDSSLDSYTPYSDRIALDELDKA